jgi:hypothetical protein
MRVKCPQCGAIVQAPDAFNLLPDPQSAGRSQKEQSLTRLGALFGTASLVALGLALSVGVLSTAALASHTEEMASFGAIAGIGFGLLASIPSFLFAVIGLLRGEKPLWPAVIGFMLSIAPAGLGLVILGSFLVGHH